MKITKLTRKKHIAQNSKRHVRGKSAKVMVNLTRSLINVENYGLMEQVCIRDGCAQIMRDIYFSHPSLMLSCAGVRFVDWLMNRYSFADKPSFTGHE